MLGAENTLLSNVCVVRPSGVEMFIVDGLDAETDSTEKTGRTLRHSFLTLPGSSSKQAEWTWTQGAGASVMLWSPRRCGAEIIYFGKKWIVSEKLSKHFWWISGEWKWHMAFSWEEVTNHSSHCHSSTDVSALPQSVVHCSLLITSSGFSVLVVMLSVTLTLLYIPSDQKQQFMNVCLLLVFWFWFCFSSCLFSQKTTTRVQTVESVCVWSDPVSVLVPQTIDLTIKYEISSCLETVLSSVNTLIPNGTMKISTLQLCSCSLSWSVNSTERNDVLLLP